jgi:four helix bundle protein
MMMHGEPIVTNLRRMAHRDLNVLDASTRAADRINALIDRAVSRSLLHANQLRNSVQSIGANIAEGFGRGTDGDRARLLRIARGEADETIRHLSANFRAKRVAPQEYWSIHNLLLVIVKMLNALLYR